MVSHHASLKYKMKSNASLLSHSFATRTTMSLDPTGLIGIGLGVPGLIEVCLTLGRKLYQLSNDYKSADEITTEIVLKLRVHWANMLDILENLDRISSRLGVQLEAEIEQMLELLRDLLRKAFEKISRLRI